MSQALTEQLSALSLEGEESDYAANGFHRRYQAPMAVMADVARVFRGEDYVLEMLTCEDRRHDLEKMRMVYTFNCLGPADRHLILVDLEPDEEASSLVEIFAAADWFEREVYDMYGVGFRDHPDLKRLLLPDDADFHALLKDFGRIDAVAQGTVED